MPTIREQRAHVKATGRRQRDGGLSQLGRESLVGAAARDVAPVRRPYLVATQLADRTGLTIGVSHFPPGTSKWNKIEHRLFCHISENWRGRPLVDHETIVQSIGSAHNEGALREGQARGLRSAMGSADRRCGKSSHGAL
jgi:hypothetical protein